MTERRRCIPIASLVAALTLTSVFCTHVQGQASDPIAAARALSAAGHYAAAAHALDAYIAAHPDDNGTRWFHAQLLAWAGMRNEARREYATVLEKTAPDDPAADSIARYIADLSNGWADIGVSGMNDDQDLHFANAAAGFGRYVSNHVALAIDAATTRFGGDDDKTLVDEELSATRTVAAASVLVNGARASLRASLGLDHSTAESHSTAIRDTTFATWSVRGAASILPARTALTASLDRSGYYWTLGSLATPVIVTAREAGIERQEPRGFTGRAAIRRETYQSRDPATGPNNSPNNSPNNGPNNSPNNGPDNTPDIDTNIAYAWIMTPALDVTPLSSLRVGYAFDVRDASGSTWNGIAYDPYYTPENARVHSVIASWSLHGLRHTAQVNGSVGFHAREDAPLLVNPSTRQVGFTPRAFTPWTLHASYAWRITWRTTLTAQADHNRTAFYNQTSAQLGTSLLIR
jgi:hypothetical protein